MKLKQSGFYLSLLIVIAACVSAFFSILHETDLAVAFYAIAALMLIFVGKTLIGNYCNFTVIFLFFSALYSLSGPITVLYGGGFPDFYPRPYLIEEFILHYSLAVIGIAAGLVLVAGLRSPRFSTTTPAPRWNRDILLMLSYTFAATASLLEIINFLRVGGFVTLFAGKAAYQGAVSELSGSLPSTLILLFSTALFGLSLSDPNMPRRIRSRCFAIWSVYALPLILSKVVLGERTTLLSIIIIFIIGYLFYRPIKNLQFKWVALGFFVYLTMAFLFGIRSFLGTIFTTHDLSILLTHVSEPIFWLTILNPSNVDFHCAFGNFNTYIISGTSDLRLGETYLRGLTQPIPRLIWPDKPQSINFEFRDTFFPEWALKGVGAGTAYSGMLEAYVNFGTFGVFIVYLFMGLAMGFLERTRMRTRSLFFAIFYLTLLPVAVTFHRSSLGMPIFWPLLFALVGYLLYILIISIFRQRYPIGEAY